MAPRFSGFGLSLSNEENTAATLALCEQAEAAAPSDVALPESRHFRAAFGITSAVLARTSRLRVRVGVVNPVTRHPAVIAMEAATIAELAPGRLVLGVGAAEWTMRALGYAPEGWKPYTQMVETIRALRRLLAGEAIGFAPTTFPGGAHMQLDFTPPPGIPLHVGAVSPRMLEASGGLADGVQLGALISPGYVRFARERITAGAQAAGRDPAEVEVSGNVLTSVDTDVRVARHAVRKVIAYYLARVEGVVVETSGADPEAVQAVRAAVAAGGVAAAAPVVSESLIRLFAVAGTAEDVVEQLAPYAEAGLDVPLAWHTLGPDPGHAIAVLGRDVRPVVCP